MVSLCVLHTCKGAETEAAKGSREGNMSLYMYIFISEVVMGREYVLICCQKLSREGNMSLYSVRYCQGKGICPYILSDIVKGREYVLIYCQKLSREGDMSLYKDFTHDENNTHDSYN